jgi:ribokinase
MKLFVLGNVGIDKFYYVKKFPLNGETILSNRVIKDIGGKGFNQAVAAARVGTKISFWTYLGVDKFNKNILSILKKENISTKNIFVTDYKSDESIIVVNEKGDNYIISSCNNALLIDLDYANNMLKEMRDGDSILLQGNLKKEITYLSVKESYKKKVKVFLNASPITHDYLELLPYVDTLIINETENKQLTNHKNISAGNKYLLKNGVKNIITTKGKDGIIYSSYAKKFCIKSPKVNVVDTTGAGDVFCGSLVAFLLKGNDYEESCNKAIKLASLSATIFGTYLSIPNGYEIANVNKP